MLHARQDCILCMISAAAQRCWASTLLLAVHDQGVLAALLRVMGCVQDESACRNHPYLHASMWMAPLPHEGSDHHMTIRGKSGAPLAGCHHDVSSHAGSRGHHPLMPSLGSWGHLSVPMHT